MRTILFIVRKETRQVLRDRLMLIQIFIPPVLQLLILAQAMTFEVKQADLALVDRDQSPASERLIERFTASGRFSVTVATHSAARADEALLTREANAILRIPEGFAAALHTGRSTAVQFVLNAEDGAAAGVTQSYASQILGAFSRAEAAARRPSTAHPDVRRTSGSVPVTIQTRALYNPGQGYLGYMSIGLLASLMTIIGLLLTAQNIAREKEIGTLEQLNVTPITKSQFIAGKLIPFWILGLIELTIGLVIIRFIFGIPFEGSLIIVYSAAAVYLLAALALGLLISTIVDTQQQALFLTFFVIVTFFFLGGIFTPVQSMPVWAQTAAELNPIKHFVFVIRTVLMKGGGWSDVGGAVAAMALFGAAGLSFAIFRYRKTST